MPLGSISCKCPGEPPSRLWARDLVGMHNTRQPSHRVGEGDSMATGDARIGRTRRAYHPTSGRLDLARERGRLAVRWKQGRRDVR